MLDFLKRAYKHRKWLRIRDFNETVITNRSGGAYGMWWKNYSDEIQRALRKWNLHLDWTPKDLRNCLPTPRIEKSLLNDVWE